MSRDTDRPEEITDEAAAGVRDRRLHGGSPQRLDDDELARRTQDERVDAGVADFDPDDVAPATDASADETDAAFDLTTTDAYQDEREEIRKQERSGDLGGQGEFPPTHPHGA